MSYQDLDLSKQAGLATLYQRLKVASQAACGPQRSLHEAGSLQRLTENQACYEQAMERAVATINHPGLNRIHSG